MCGGEFVVVSVCSECVVVSVWWLVCGGKCVVVSVCVMVSVWW